MPKKQRAKRKTRFSLFKLWPLLLIAALIATGYYFYSQYQASDVAEEGVVVCNKNRECEKSIHIHADLEVTICSQLYALDKDTGELADIHTHKESNTLHFHERLKSTPSGEILDYSPLYLNNSVKSLLNFDLTNECIGQWCNGEKCPNGKRGKLGLTVNDEKVKEIPAYVWKDGDKIQLTFE